MLKNTPLAEHRAQAKYPTVQSINIYEHVTEILPDLYKELSAGIESDSYGRVSKYH